MPQDGITENKPEEHHIEIANDVNLPPNKFKSEEGVVTGKTWIVIGVTIPGTHLIMQALTFG
jgi:hypothetical protein